MNQKGGKSKQKEGNGGGKKEEEEEEKEERNEKEVGKELRFPRVPVTFQRFFRCRNTYKSNDAIGTPVGANKNIFEY